MGKSQVKSIAYCVRCQQKRELFNSEGICSVCGEKMAANKKNSKITTEKPLNK